MKIAFFSNYLNHHQTLLSDELYKLTNGDYHFIETMDIPEFRRKIGYKDYSSKPYCVQAWKNAEEAGKADRICKEADVVLFIPSTAHYGIIAAKSGKICFEVGERWLKKGLVNFLSPRLLKNIWYYYTVFRKKKVFRLCNSAFAANDVYRMQTYKNRCYKWGYFTEVNDLDIESVINSRDNGQIKIMWCARFLDWKHPELPVKMASRLNKKGYDFHINMFGDGNCIETTKQLATKLDVNEQISFKGNIPNDEILPSMREHDIFIFTSDKNEGWGAVANEAMSNCCAIVASDMIGSIPFLVKDGENGCIFKSEDVESLTEKVEWLINNPEDRKRLAINGYHTMKNLWSPTNAAKNLLQLIDDIKKGHDTTILEGPCSKALP